MLLRNPSFALLIRDPKAQQLAAEGRGAELLPLLAEKQQLRRQAMNRMGRSAQQAPAEAEFLQTALQAMKEGAAAKGAPMKERESLRFQEMIRRMEYAQSLAEKGIALDGKTAGPSPEAPGRTTCPARRRCWWCPNPWRTG